MKIFIRADANTDLGMGHVMRCLSIADAIRNAGLKVIFIIADEDIAYSIIKDRGYNVIALHTDYRKTESELAYWPFDMISSDDCVIVDSYFVTLNYLNVLRKKIRLVYIDDMAAFPYPCDVLINYNNYASLQTYKNLYNSQSLPELLLGVSYAPLRKMFRNVPRKIQPEKVENILISTGGADFLHLALKFIKSDLPKNFI